MRIHPVILIAQLEPAHQHEDDPYNRQPNINLPPVENDVSIDDPTETAPSYEIERLLDK